MNKTFKTADASWFIAEIDAILKEFGYQGEDLSRAMRTVTRRGNWVSVGQPICEDGCVMARLEQAAIK